MKAAEQISLPGGAGYTLPVNWYPAESARGSVILMAALGMGARFYQPLAQALQAAGLNVALVEQRGHGDSPWRPSRDCDWGFREPLVNEIPVALDWVKSRSSGVPVYLMGHSLGGHYAAMAAGVYGAQIDGIILAACGSPWLGGFAGATRRKLKFLCAMIPPASALLGYYPGDRLGFGGREARTLMQDWLALAKTNRYQANGFSEDLDCGIAQYTGPVLSLRMADDAFAPPMSVDAVTEKFITATVSSVLLDAQTLGDRADHFRWVRSPAATVQQIVRWHEKQQSGK